MRPSLVGHLMEEITSPTGYQILHGPASDFEVLDGFCFKRSVIYRMDGQNEKLFQNMCSSINQQSCQSCAICLFFGYIIHRHVSLLAKFFEMICYQSTFSQKCRRFQNDIKLIHCCSLATNSITRFIISFERRLHHHLWVCLFKGQTRSSKDYLKKPLDGEALSVSETDQLANAN